MNRAVKIGLIGDYDPGIDAHRAIPLALQQAAAAWQVKLAYIWVPTEQIGSAERVEAFDGLWCVPGSPYRDTDGALRAIEHARTAGVPFLGTCGGFQHALLEFARNVLGWQDAAHAETDPEAPRAVIAPLSCALIDTEATIRLLPDSLIASAYRAAETEEIYRCSYGLNPDFEAALCAGPLRVTARDADGQARAVELDGHPFFVATLFQPERAVLQGTSAPLVQAFVQAAARHAAGEKEHPEPDAARFATLPEPPYFAAIFSSQRTRGDNGYHQMATRMLELAQAQPGFLGIESTRDAQGFGITVSYWQSEQAIADWRAHVEHRLAQENGRQRWYAQFQLRVARVDRAAGSD